MSASLSVRQVRSRSRPALHRGKSAPLLLYFLIKDSASTQLLTQKCGICTACQVCGASCRRSSWQPVSAVRGASASVVRVDPGTLPVDGPTLTCLGTHPWSAEEQRYLRLSLSSTGWSAHPIFDLDDHYPYQFRPALASAYIIFDHRQRLHRHRHHHHPTFSAGALLTIDGILIAYTTILNYHRHHHHQRHGRHRHIYHPSISAYTIFGHTNLHSHHISIFDDIFRIIRTYIHTCMHAYMHTSSSSSRIQDF